MSTRVAYDGPVIDFGGHLYPEASFPDPLEGSSLLEYLGDRLTDPATLMEEYRSAGIDGGVVSQPFYMGTDDVDAASHSNDALQESLDPYDDLYEFAAIPTAAGGTEAAAEFERCLENGFHGGAIETGSDGIGVTDDELEPVYDVAEEHGAPILVHPTLFSPIHPDVFGKGYGLDAIVGREVALAESLVESIHSGLLDRHDDLDLVFHHLGGTIASYMGRFEAQTAANRRGSLENGKPFEEFKAQLEERVYVDTCGFFGYHAPLQTALSELPTDRILFATDYPFEPETAGDMATFRKTVEDLTPNTDASRVLGGNVLNLLANV